MKKKEKIDHEITQTMKALEGISSAEPKPFFYTRLKARMENTQRQMPAQIQWVLKPAVFFSTLSMILLINIFVAINYTHQSTVQQTDTQQTLDSFANEYDLSDSN